MADTDTEPEAEPELMLDLPPGFAGLPLRSAAEDNAATVAELARTLAHHSGQPVDDMAAQVDMLANLLTENRIRLYGRFAVTDESANAPVTADLMLAVATMGADDEQVLPPCDVTAISRLLACGTSTWHAYHMRT